MSLVKANKTPEKVRCLRLKGSWGRMEDYSRFTVFPREAHQIAEMGHSSRDEV